MDHVDKVLSTVSTSDKYSAPIQVACGIAKKALNRYYSYTDMSATYRIAMSKSWCIVPRRRALNVLLTTADVHSPAVLHPSHKLHYFKKMRWPDAWRTTAKNLFVAKYLESYEGRFMPDDDDDDDEGSGKDVADDDNIRAVRRSGSWSVGTSSGRSSRALGGDDDEDLSSSNEEDSPSISSDVSMLCPCYHGITHSFHSRMRTSSTPSPQ